MVGKVGAWFKNLVPANDGAYALAA